MVKYLVAQNKAYHASMAVSIVADKARVGNVDNLFAAVMDVETGISSWLPPQAFSTKYLVIISFCMYFAQVFHSKDHKV